MLGYCMDRGAGVGSRTTARCQVLMIGKKAAGSERLLRIPTRRARLKADR